MEKKTRKGSALLATIVIASCSTVPSPFHPPVWSDTPRLLLSLRCALEQSYTPTQVDAIMRFKLLVLDTPVTFKEQVTPDNLPVITVNGGARNAVASLIRHAVLNHMVPHVVGNPKTWNFYHLDAWTENARRLDIVAGRCRGGVPP